MENVKCTKYGCKSTSFRKMSEYGSTVTLKCNICGTTFKVQKNKNSTANSSTGRSVYGDRPSYGTTSSYRNNDDDYDYRSSSKSPSDDYNSSPSPSYDTSSSYDSYGGGSSDGGGSSSDF